MVLSTVPKGVVKSNEVTVLVAKSIANLPETVLLPMKEEVRVPVKSYVVVSARTDIGKRVSTAVAARRLPKTFIVNQIFIVNLPHNLIRKYPRANRSNYVAQIVRGNKEVNFGSNAGM